MLTYTLSEDLNQASIGPCTGGRVRLSIIRICKGQGWEFPPETLEEATDVETLKDIHLDLQLRRSSLRQAARAAESARHALEQAERERRLPPQIVARVADLRARAASIRNAAEMAERVEILNQELAEAARLETEALRLARPRR